MKYLFLDNKEWYYRNKDGMYILLPPGENIEDVKKSHDQYLKDIEVDNLVNSLNNDIAGIRNKFKSRNENGNNKKR